MNQYQEGLFYHNILNEPRFLENTLPDYFTNMTVKELFKISKEHTLKYKEAPTKKQVEELVKIKGYEEKITNDIISAVYDQQDLINQYDEKWLEDNTQAWIKIKNLEHTMRKAIAFMKTTDMNVENATSTVETIRSMLTTETAMDFSFNLGSSFFDPSSHSQETLARTSTGYPYLDTCLKGGWWSGSLVAFLSGPKSGKSMWLCNLAAESCKQGDNVAFITLELQPAIVMSRIGSNLLNVSSATYEEFSKDKTLLSSKLRDLRASQIKPMGEFHVKQFGTSTASSTDIGNYLRKTEELLGIKFQRVFIDYINIMKNWRNPNSENTYMKIKQIAEDLRAEAGQSDWTIITVTQTKLGNWGDTDMQISDVSESAGLIHTVDGFFGIITNPEMKAMGKYYLKCLANRVAPFENTRKAFNMYWDYCRITEDITAPVEDMEMIAQLNNNNQRSRNIKDASSGYVHDNKISGIKETNILISNNMSSYTPEHINVTGKELFEI